jgi:hypothetical protein
MFSPKSLSCGMELQEYIDQLIRLTNNSKLLEEVGFEVFTAVTMKLQVPAHAGSSLADFSTLKMEAIRSPETSVQSTISTRRHNPENGILLEEDFLPWNFLHI